MLSSVEQAFVGRDERRAPLKTPLWEATTYKAPQFIKRPVKKIPEIIEEKNGKSNFYSAATFLPSQREFFHCCHLY